MKLASGIGSLTLVRGRREFQIGLSAGAVVVGVLAIAATARGNPAGPASPNATHACLAHAGLKTTYLSAADSIGAKGDLLVTFTASDHAQLSFERTDAAARKDARVGNEQSRILTIYAGGYTIRNVAISWTHKPSAAEREAIRSCVKP